MSLEEEPCSIRPEARPVPYMRYVHGTLTGPSAQVPVVVRAELVIRPEPVLAEWGVDRVTGGLARYELTLIGRTRAMMETLGGTTKQELATSQAPSLTLTVSGQEFPVYAEEASHTHDGYLSVKANAPNLLWSSTVWTADQFPPEPGHLVPDGQRLLGHATVQLQPGEFITPERELDMVLEAWSECRRTLERSAPHAPLFPAIEYTYRPSLVLRVIAIEEVLQGPFTATLIDGPSAGVTLPQPRPRRVIRGVSADGEVVEYRPVPGRPRWYSIHGGPLE